MVGGNHVARIAALGRRLALYVCAALLFLGTEIRAEEKAFDLSVPEALQQTGIMKFILPRFSLKTGVRITIVADGGAAGFGPEGTPVFMRDDTIWHLTGEGEHIERFRTWLTSEIGMRTIESFVPEDGVAFSTNLKVEVAVAAPSFDGDAARGADLALQHCGRCHVIGDVNRMSGMGSSPSFAVLRTFADWGNRFETFYILKPHAAFTQIKDVTEPFDPERPPPIVPVEMTLDDLDAILAFVTAIAPADLGAPVKSQ